MGRKGCVGGGYDWMEFFGGEERKCWELRIVLPTLRCENFVVNMKPTI